MTPKQLKAIRTRSGLYQRELAAAIGVSERLIRGYESGDKKLPKWLEYAVRYYYENIW